MLPAQAHINQSVSSLALRKKIRSRLFSNRSRRKLPGAVPGTAVYTGIHQLSEAKILIHDFDESHYEQIPVESITDSKEYLENPSKTWIQVQGLHDMDALEEIWNYFDMHPLVREDIVNTVQRPKIEQFPEYLFFVLRAVVDPVTGQGENSDEATTSTEQISIVLGKNYVISFQESDLPIFDPIIKRIHQPSSRLRRFQTDYLAYALIDTVVDHYFQFLDSLNGQIDELEDFILDEAKPEHLQRIHSLRRDLIYFRKSVWSLRDAINTLIRDDSPLISEELTVFLRDVYDHIVQIIDMVESSREVVFGMFDIYMSNLSHRMNEVMKVLTIIATIFIPLTFVAGIYGMNFDPEASPYNMPELSWYYGYPLSLGIMLLLVIGMLIYFRRKDWL